MTFWISPNFMSGFFALIPGRLSSEKYMNAVLARLGRFGSFLFFLFVFFLAIKTLVTDDELSVVEDSESEESDEDASEQLSLF